jgi:hypothetical protein
VILLRRSIPTRGYIIARVSPEVCVAKGEEKVGMGLHFLAVEPQGGSSHELNPTVSFGQEL